MDCKRRTETRSMMVALALLVVFLVVQYGCSKKGNESDVPDVPWDRTGMIVIEGVYYFSLPKLLSDSPKYENTVDKMYKIGEIIKSVPGPDLPEGDFSSNVLSEGTAIYKDGYHDELYYAYFDEGLLVFGIPNTGSY